MELIDELKSEVKRRNIQDPKEVQSVISEKLVEIYEGGEQEAAELRVEDGRLNIILFVGVNGVGKTTTIGKLAINSSKKAKMSSLLPEIHSEPVRSISLKCGESASARMSSNRLKARTLRPLSMTPFKPRKRAAPMFCFATRQDVSKIK
jgi:translation initiation factor RLI1